MIRSGPFDAVKRFFAALSLREAAAIRASATADFQLLEQGELWDCQRLIDALQGDYRRRNFFALIESEEFEQRAWLSYWNRALITGPDGSVTTMIWLESAVVHYLEHGWRVRMLHSTRAVEESIPIGILLEEDVAAVSALL